MKNDEKYGILFKSAIELRELICSKKISPVEIEAVFNTTLGNWTSITGASLDALKSGPPKLK